MMIQTHDQMKRIPDASINELLCAHKECRIWYYYYEAAERNWRSETQERQDNWKLLTKIETELRDRGYASHTHN